MWFLSSIAGKHCQTARVSRASDLFQPLHTGDQWGLQVTTLPAAPVVSAQLEEAKTEIRSKHEVSRVNLGV